MKRLLYVITAVMLAWVTPVRADLVPALSIKTDATEQTIPLADISKVTHTDTEVCLTLRTGNTVTLLLDDIVSMTFTEWNEEASGIGLTSASGKKTPKSSYLLNGTRAKENERKQIIIIKAGKETRKVAK